MDLLRSAIEASFYWMPCNVIAAQIGNSDDGFLKKTIVEIVKRRSDRFSNAEIQLLADILNQKWTQQKEFKITADYYTLLQRLPLIFNEFTTQVLAEKGRMPVVRFNHLLRWRELSLLTGEDVLTLTFLANLDVRKNFHRKDFVWPNVIDHDNFRLNAILEKELSDTHSHVNAASDIFEFNWIYLMNCSFAKEDLSRVKNFNTAGFQMEYDIATPFSKINHDLFSWIVIAQAIRLTLFSEIYGRTEDELGNEAKAFFENPDLDNADSIKTLAGRLIERLNLEGMKTKSGVVLDYAIPTDDFSVLEPSSQASPFAIHQGERKLIYDWLHGYYSGDERSLMLAPKVVLYLLVKNKVRREFIQSNGLIGFDNFKDYQDTKMAFIGFGNDKNRQQAYIEAMYRYAIQSSIGDTNSHYLEARLTPGVVSEFRDVDVKESIFGTDSFLKSDESGKLSYVVHFIKKPDKTAEQSCRHSSQRIQLWNDVRTIVDDFKNNTKAPFITGIDAASSELACRPEVFAPMFRFAGLNGLTNFTFHAGEDFYDIVDGLRTINETIDFLDYKTGCRIGHGLALGVDTTSFYEERHYTLVIPRQVWLDNLVWMNFKAAEHNIRLSPETQVLIQHQFALHSALLGYGENVNIYNYYQSMLLRGDARESSQHKTLYENPYVRFSPVSPRWEECPGVVLELHEIYERDGSIRTKGVQAIVVNLPKSFSGDVAQIQECMLKQIEERGIVIETNPSSNIKIGRFSRYDQHPLPLFHNPTGDARYHSLVVTINTDDKGVFATSLKNEYSLMALAMHKKKNKDGSHVWSDLQIEEYLRRLAHYSNITRFRIY